MNKGLLGDFSSQITNGSYVGVMCYRFKNGQKFLAAPPIKRWDLFPHSLNLARLVTCCEENATEVMLLSSESGSQEAGQLPFLPSWDTTAQADLLEKERPCGTKTRHPS